MESTGEPGRIQVTAAVETRLRDRFELEPRGMFDVKGIGPMATYFLVGESKGRSPAAR
jgi:adenylate cyclase